MRGRDELVAPPYHIYDIDMLYLLCRFDKRGARAAIPSALEPVDDALGVIMLLEAKRGWVVAPFTGLVAGLQVKGYDGADKYPANYNHTAIYSGACGEVFGKVYNDHLTPGFARLWTEGDTYYAEAGRDGRDTIRVSARRTERISNEVVGMNHYLSSLGNGIITMSTSYSTRFRDLEDVSIEISEAAPEPLRSLRPLEVVWPIRIDGMQMTFNAARPLQEDADVRRGEAIQAAMFDLLKRLNRPAALVTRSGRVIFLTPEATELLGPASSSVLLSSKVRGQRSLTGAIGRTIEQGVRGVDEPVLLEHPSGRPVFAQVLPVFSGITDEPAVLVLFADPTNTRTGDSLGALQMLGLTAAEARIAELVGRGRSPDEAADELSLSHHTTRSAMRGIFDKLDISRQSQLARLVARLEMM